MNDKLKTFAPLNIEVFATSGAVWSRNQEGEIIVQLVSCVELRR